MVKKIGCSLFIIYLIGALAERVALYPYLLYCIVLTGFVQPVTVHWTWSNGFLLRFFTYFLLQNIFSNKKMEKSCTKPKKLYPNEAFGLPENVFFRDYAGGNYKNHIQWSY